MVSGVSRIPELGVGQVDIFWRKNSYDEQKRSCVGRLQLSYILLDLIILPTPTPQLLNGFAQIPWAVPARTGEPGPQVPRDYASKRGDSEMKIVWKSSAPCQKETASRSSTGQTPVAIAVQKIVSSIMKLVAKNLRQSGRHLCSGAENCQSKIHNV